MITILKNITYARLFLAQIVALLGTGLLTVALGLLAFDLAGAHAGAVLGTAFAIKMVAYVGLAPVAAALSDHLPTKAVLIGADLVRAMVALTLPFIDAVWQIYGLIFVLQAASATFTPAFQAIIPEILTDERDYTKALSLSRLAYDLENLVSPAIAGVLLVFVSYHWLFSGTFAGFAASTLLIASTVIPTPSHASRKRPFRERLTRGSQIYLATPRLRGLLALNLAAAAAGAYILVNSVVIVRLDFGRSATDVAYALAAFGGGSMLAALALPRLLETRADRSLMLVASLLLAVLTLGHASYLLAGGEVSWAMFLLIWSVSGVLYATILTPSGRLLRHSAHAEDRPAIFAAQFALSHACWLITYPVAGWAGEALGRPAAMAILGTVALAAAFAATRIWPAATTKDLRHTHPDLPDGHAHLRQFGHREHHHVFIIDDEHRVWPTQG